MTSYDTSPEFGAIYDAVPVYAQRTADIAFYAGEAAQLGADAPVLELGCGTGRVSLPIARAGHPVTGVDLSPAMLERFREKLAAEAAEVRARVRLHEGDIRDFDVAAPTNARGFELAIAPFRVFQHMTTIDDQLRCLATVRRHLAPGGRFAFDVFNPHFAKMTADRTGETEDTPELTLPDGRTLRRTVRVSRIHWVRQLSDVELIYYLGSGGSVERVVHKFEMRWFTASELEHLLVRAGFRVDARYGDVEKGRLEDDSPEIVIVAARSD
jgi:SAM-dependent methyltransferase